MNIEDEFRFDVRIQNRMVKKGLVNEDELKTRLEALRDLEDESELLELDQPGLLPAEAEVEVEKKETL